MRTSPSSSLLKPRYPAVHFAYDHPTIQLCSPTESRLFPKPTEYRGSHILPDLTQRSLKPPKPSSFPIQLPLPHAVDLRKGSVSQIVEPLPPKPITLGVQQKAFPWLFGKHMLAPRLGIHVESGLSRSVYFLGLEWVVGWEGKARLGV